MVVCKTVVALLDTQSAMTASISAILLVVIFYTEAQAIALPKNGRIYWVRRMKRNPAVHQL